MGVEELGVDEMGSRGSGVTPYKWTERKITQEIH